MRKLPYGYAERRCTNAEPGTYGHECGKRAVWIGTTKTGFRAAFCTSCRYEGSEAKDVISWVAFDQAWAATGQEETVR